MTIQTSGPRLGDVTISEIQATNAAHDRQLALDAVLALAAIVLVIGLAIVLPRLWRRARTHLDGPVRMPSPPSGARGTNG